MMEVITILVCFIKKFVIGWANKRNLAKLQPLKDQAYVAPVNPEIESLRARKLEIQSTMEEFNNPTTFAKYSKMQRQLLKIQKQVEQLTCKLEEQSKTNKAQWQAARQIAKNERKEARSRYVKRSWIIRILINFTLIRLVHNYYTFPIPFAHEWPLSMFTQQDGTVKCSFLMAAGNMLFQF